MKHLGMIAVAALLTCPMSNAQSGNPSNPLVALEQSFNGALMRTNWKVIEQLEADDLVFTNADGSVTHKSDEVAGIKSGDEKFESIDMSDVKVQEFGSMAVVTGKLVEKGHYKAVDLGGAYRFTDVWAKRSGRWQLVTGQETRYAERESLLGSWQLVSYEDRDESGKLILPYGKNPAGLLIYDSTGHMSGQIMKTPPPDVASNDWDLFTTAEKVALFDGYVAYFGGYEVNESQHIVTHLPTADLSRLYIGRREERHYEINGDQLVLSEKWTQSGRKWSGVRVFRRLQ